MSAKCESFQIAKLSIKVFKKDHKPKLEEQYE